MTDKRRGSQTSLQIVKPGLVVNEISKRYKNRQVVRGVSLHIKRGEAVALLGPNGAGKTTCFYMICGLVPPERGQIILDGVDITSMPMYRRARMGLSYLPQESSIFRGLSVEDNIRAVLEGLKLSAAQIDERVHSLLEEFKLLTVRQSPALALSGGERRRVEIARALATSPAFIMLDEPLAGIDPIAVADIRNLIAHLKDRGIGVLITDHNVRDALGIVDRAYVLAQGTILSEGTPEQIINNPDVRRVYLGEDFATL